jgi:glucan biosynthesis protein C
LPIALLVVFPLGMALLSTNRVPRLITDALAAAFAWMMIFGLMGLCRRWLARENPRVRYVSDASYFVYIMHMPVLLILSNTLARFALPRPVKILLLCIVTVGLLLWVYEHGVRYHWLGRWLNGPRERPGRLGPSSAGLSGMPSRWPGHPTRLDGTKNPRFRGLVPRMKRMLSFSYP